MANKMNNSTKKKVIYILSILVGMFLGYLYHVNFSCKSGACPIVSSPFVMCIWGGLIGFFIGEALHEKWIKKSNS